jgi:hypothetical protein
MNLDKDKPKPLKTDEKAPELLELIIQDKETGEIFMKETVQQKHFSTGSVGYYCGGKLTNPFSGERYQVSCNIALIGSKPK